MRSNARIAFGGSASSYARLFAESVYADSTLAGNVQITIPYFRLGSVGGGHAEISIFIRDASGSTVRRTAELPGSGSSYESVTEQFYLQDGEFYDIGLEVSTSVSGINSYVYADFYNRSTAGQRRVELNGSIDIETLD